MIVSRNKKRNETPLPPSQRVANEPLAFSTGVHANISSYHYEMRVHTHPHHAHTHNTHTGPHLRRPSQAVSEMSLQAEIADRHEFLLKQLDGLLHPWLLHFKDRETEINYQVCLHYFAPTHTLSVSFSRSGRACVRVCVSVSVSVSVCVRVRREFLLKQLDGLLHPWLLHFKDRET